VNPLLSPRNSSIVTGLSVSVAGAMGFRDRFFTPRTAKAILSWRIVIGVGVAAALAVGGVALGVAIAVGVAVYVAAVAAAMPKRASSVAIDPFVLSEPWRQLVQGSQAAHRKLRSTVGAVGAGPLRSQLEGIAEQIERGLQDAWQIAKRGDEIDDAVRSLDPTALRSKLATLEQRAAASRSPEADAAVASVRSQLDSADRLKQQSAETAATLRLTQTRLDELVARANEVRIGAADTEVYANDVDDVVLQLEALRQAIEETRTA
jgi:hypothetical protein